jgi:hypothetical protein
MIIARAVKYGKLLSNLPDLQVRMLGRACRVLAPVKGLKKSITRKYYAPLITNSSRFLWMQSSDRVVFTLADGSTASIEAMDLQGGPKQVKAKLLGG